MAVAWIGAAAVPPSFTQTPSSTVDYQGRLTEYRERAGECGGGRRAVVRAGAELLAQTPDEARDGLRDDVARLDLSRYRVDQRGSVLSRQGSVLGFLNGDGRPRSEQACRERDPCCGSVEQVHRR